MIVDTSAVIAILRDERDAAALARAMESQSSCRMSAVSYVEAGVVTDANRNPILSRRLDTLLDDLRIQLMTVTVNQAKIARQAYRDFGKGRHKAGLNLGDCFAYALAKEMNEPLLFKGEDFRHTDVEIADVECLWVLASRVLRLHPAFTKSATTSKIESSACIGKFIAGCTHQRKEGLLWRL